MVRGFLFTVLVFSATGCALGSKLKDTSRTTLLDGIKYRAAVGDREQHIYLSHSETKKFQANELVNKKIEKVQFDLHSHVRKIDLATIAHARFT